MMKRINRILMVVAISMATVNANAWPWVSPYAYCMGNPVMFIDPYGEEPTSKEAAYAVSLGRQFASLYDGCEKTIVGHSLGGGLATAASMSTDIPAITFNPAAMTEHTKAQLGIQNSAGANVTNYVVAGEPLSVLQNKAGMQLPGNTNYIYIQNSSSNPFVNSFNAHKISTIKHILPR